jgi:hypothetical protein
MGHLLALLGMSAAAVACGSLGTNGADGLA